jgi:glyoxylase-like metal-dependent hydrolase (beta-lactamase superfamily II)
MKIFNVTEGSQIYTCNAYLLLGAWNTLHDLNTLIDVGCEPEIIRRIRGIYTGVGKKEIEQVILTHNHMDHTGSLKLIREHFSPKVYAFTPGEGVDELLADGQCLRIADNECEIIHVPQHSYDSVCIYFKEEHILFAGDTPLVIRGTDGSYEAPFIRALERLVRMKIESIYFGHGQPLIGCGDKTIAESLKNARDSFLPASAGNGVG